MENHQKSRYHRIDFSCKHVGKRFSHTKRKLLWRFGRRHIENKTRRPGDLQGEVHQVQLTWSLVSGKAVVLWDGKTLKHLCRRDDVISGHSLVKFTWTSDEGDPFQIVAYSSEISDIPNQYELFVNGKSFSSLPSVLEIGCSSGTYELSPLERLNAQSSSRSVSFKMKDMGKTPPMTNVRKRLPLQQCNNNGLEHKNLECSEKQDSHSMTKDSSTILPSRSVESPSDIEALNISSCFDESRPSEFDESVLEDTAQQQCRLSAAGLLQATVERANILHDELQSPCSSTLEHLRQEIAADVPETEDMMSRAIIMAFSEGRNHNSESLSSLASSTDELDCDNIEMIVEADALWESLEWMKSVSESEECPIYDIQERKLSFMQKQINGLFSAVRQENLSPNAAKRTIHGIATVLDLELTTTEPTDLVVVLSGGNIVNTRPSSLRVEAQKYGTIKGIAFATKCSDFGICRFETSSSARQAASASLEKSVGHVGEYPRFVELNMAVAAVSSLGLDSSFEDAIIDEDWTNSNRTAPPESNFKIGQKSSTDLSMDGDSIPTAPLSPPPPPPPSMPPSLGSNDVAFERYVSSGQTSLYKQSETSISTASTEASSTDSEFFY